MKMPVKVWKEVVKIQRDFLWGGLSKKTRICWVRWNDICKPKKEAGLGIKDLRMVNISLLTKWRWKLLSHQSEVWKDVVMAKYGPHISGKGNLGVSDVTRMSSTWWKDICNPDKDSIWFVEAVEKRVGNGNLTTIWTDTWIGDQSLQQRFPRIYGISNQKESTIFNMGRWVENTWSWEFDWRRNLFVWEEPIKAEFLDVINQFVPSERDDLWLWRENKDDGFSVKSCYDMLQNKFSLSSVLEPSEELAYSMIWKCGAPSKVCAFSWQLLWDRLQTKDNLQKRRILHHQQTMCVICGTAIETNAHLFLHCDFVAKVWYALMRWLGLVVIIPHNLVCSFGMTVGCGKDRREKECLILIWNSFMWKDSSFFCLLV
jgi:hypothetical protein